jgi:hypothetical protein
MGKISYRKNKVWDTERVIVPNLENLGDKIKTVLSKKFPNTELDIIDFEIISLINKNYAVVVFFQIK